MIPLFKQQIVEGGPVTVADPDIIRYFMTIPEAVSHVSQADAYARGGEIFALDIGKSIEFAAEVFEKQLDELIADAKKEDKDIRKQIKEVVPTYQWGEKYGIAKMDT